MFNQNLYTNKLDLSLASKNKEVCLSKVYSKFMFNKPLDRLQNLGLYIYPDGRMVDTLSHDEIDKFLISSGDIKLNGDFQEVKEGSQFMDLCNCVRVRCDIGLTMGWIMLPCEELTNEQYEKISIIIDVMLSSNINLYVFTLNQTWDKTYSKSYYDFSDDVLKDIKRYYKTQK